MQAVTALAAIHAAAALVPSLQFQLITFVLYVLMYPTTSLASTALVAAAPRQLGYRRSSIFSIGTVYVARVFGFARLSVVLGMWQTAGGLLNLTTPALTAFVLEDLRGDWSIVLCTFLALCLPQALLVARLPLQRRHRSLLAGSPSFIAAP